MNKRQKKKQRIKQVGMIVFLVLIALGFMVPGFLHNNNEGQPSHIAAEPRLCQSDSDCYLTCDGVPIASICSQNLCLQNSCDEVSYYPYIESPISLTLDVEVNGVSQSLSGRSLDGDFFVTFDDSNTQVYTTGLRLNSILEKANMGFTHQDCLLVDADQYCHGEGELTMHVNGEENNLFGNYIPAHGDDVRISFE